MRVMPSYKMVFHGLPRISSRVYVGLLLSFLAAAGLYFRLIYLQTISLHVDEFISLLAARGILQHGFPLLPSGTLYEQGLLFSYLEALILRGFGFSATGGRVLSLIVSVAVIPLLYYIGRRLFSAPVGLVAATLSALSAQSIAWGGRVRMHALLQLLVLLSVWFLWRGAIRQNDARYRWLSILCYLGALFTHPVSVLLFPPFLLSLLLQRGIRGLLKPASILELAVPVGGILTTLLLKMVGQPGQLEALAQTRPYLAPSLDVIAGFRPFAPFFLSSEGLPLTLLVTGGFLILITAVVLNIRGRTSIEMFQPDLRTPLFLYTILGTAIFEMVFLVGPTWRDVRYLFMLEPLFFLIASWMAVSLGSWVSQRMERRVPAWLWDRSKTEPISWPLTCLLVAWAFVLFLPGARAMISQQEWGYDLAFEYLQERWQDGDTVLSIVPFACDLYLPQCDYYASGRAYEEYVFEKDGVLVDRWIGAPLLDSASQLDSVLRDSSRVWFLVDGWRLAARFDLSFIRSVAEQMDVVHEVQGVRVLLMGGYKALPEPVTSESMQVNFADQIELVGYELYNDVLAPGSDLLVTLYWEALRPIEQEYTVFVHLMGQNGSQVAQNDSPPLENLYPTNYWVEGERVPDFHVLSIPTGVSPGRYRLEVGLYLPQDQQRLAILGEDGSPSGDTAIVDYVQVGENAEGLMPQYAVEANLDDKIVLMGHEGISHSIEAGQDIHLTLYWQALARMEEDYTVFIHLLDEEGRILAQHDDQPLLGFYPTSFWDEGDIVRDEYDIHVESSTLPGEYELAVGMYLLRTGDRLPVLDNESQIAGDLISLGRIVLTER
jgi:4-amino-4-deoxy-L-arabinose transferase-like glycosyltransferase